MIYGKNFCRCHDVLPIQQWLKSNIK
jgi:hypothetical protein